MPGQNFDGTTTFGMFAARLEVMIHLWQSGDAVKSPSEAAEVVVGVFDEAQCRVLV
jgi:hypothetical protein